MKINLLIYFLSVTILTFGQRDRDIIKQIDSINATALIYYNTSDIVKSFNGFNKAKALSESIQDDYGNAIANYNLGNIYNLMQNTNAADKCYNAMLKSANKIDDTYLIVSAYLHLGKLYKDIKEFKKATLYLDTALKHAVQIVEVDKIDHDKRQIQSFLFDIKINLSE